MSPQDDFGNAVRIKHYVDTQPDENGLTPELDAFIERWETSTSTYGGDSVTDCCEV